MKTTRKRLQNSKLKAKLLPVSTFVFLLMVFSPVSGYSQYIGQAKPVSNVDLEKITMANFKNGKAKYDGVLSFTQYNVNPSQAMVSEEEAVKKIKAIPGVLECSIVDNGAHITVVTAKEENNPVAAIVKKQLFDLGYVFSSITESPYKL